MKAEYLILLALVISVPLFFSRDPNLSIHRNGSALLKVMAVVCVPFWLWDIIATARGHWSFNPAYTVGITIVGMPLEEWLFFIVIGFVSIVTWESAKYFERRDP